MLTYEINIRNLRLRVINGLRDWEREKLQDIVVNIRMRVRAADAACSDSVEDTADYRAISKRVIASVEKSQFHLLEALAAHVHALVREDERVIAAEVVVDKPHALRFADSVAVRCADADGW